MEVVGAFIAVYLVLILAVMGLGVVQYVFHSLGLYTMAKRRGISKPWLAWIPVGSDWLLGCISDQYQYVAKGMQKSKRSILLWLNVVLCIVMAAYVVVMALMALEASSEAEVFGSLLIMAGTGLAMFGLSVWYCIVFYMAQYDLFRSADPDNAVLYLLLSIFLGSVVNTIMVFICRNKDGGMPPRRAPAAVEQIPLQQPVIHEEPYQGSE